jgi:hypothetical protein
MPVLPPPSEFDSSEFLEFEKRRGLGNRTYGWDEAKAVIGGGDTRLSQLMKSGELPFTRLGLRKLGFGGRDLAMVLFKARGKPHDLPSVRPPKLLTTKPTRRRPGRPRKGRIRTLPQIPKSEAV